MAADPPPHYTNAFGAHTESVAAALGVSVGHLEQHVFLSPVVHTSTILGANIQCDANVSQTFTFPNLSGTYLVPSSMRVKFTVTKPAAIRLHKALRPTAFNDTFVQATIRIDGGLVFGHEAVPEKAVVK